MPKRPVKAGYYILIQPKDASGGPAGGQTFETFDKQVLFFKGAPQPSIPPLVFLFYRNVFAELFSNCDPPEATEFINALAR